MCVVCQSVAIVVVIIRAPFLLVYYILGYSSQLSFTTGFASEMNDNGMGVSCAFLAPPPPKP